MKVLVTGANGFIGKNLVCALKNIKDGNDRRYPELSIDEIYEFDIDTDKGLLDEYCKDTDFVFHLAGVNRPECEEEFMNGNFGFTIELLDMLKKHSNKAPIMMSSSIQAMLDIPYGKSKKAGEDLIFNYGKKNDIRTLVYRFPNVFGKWCRPNYNSVVATFCHNIANDLPIKINDREHIMTLVYIDDVVDELLNALRGAETKVEKFCKVSTEHKIALGEIADLIYMFRDQSKTLLLPEIPDNSFAKKLYSTYISYLPKEKISIPLKMNVDDRGSFTELLKTEKCGQFSVNISKPGITKGQHWHNTKWEFFFVVSGNGLIQQRKIGTDEILEFEVSGEKIEAVRMLPGYTHCIKNLSDTECLVTLMWANERFNPDNPDTFFEVI